jgi:hypothetical protein
MFNALVALPALFVAWIVKLEVPTVAGMPTITPIVVGTPEIVPATVFKLKPLGRSPLAMVHVIGPIPLALSGWL